MASTKGARLVANSVLPGGFIVAKKVAAKPVAKSTPVVAAAAKPASPAAPAVPPGHLARLTAYWTQEDPWTAKHESSTGIRLHEGHCAVDPKLIPYGSVVQIPGMGTYVAVDTGSAVISRQAALGSGQTEAQRNALVVDLFFESRQEAEDFAAHGPAYVSVSWTPRSLAYANSASDPRALPAIPTMPAGTVYVLAQAPSLADTRMPLAFRAPQL
jgi:3D (Asp-Asp-Asp) domain-containing protein